MKIEEKIILFNKSEKKILLFTFIDLLSSFFYIYYNYLYLVINFLNIGLVIKIIYSLKKINIESIFFISFIRLIKCFFNFIYLVYYYSNYKYNNIIYIINFFIFLQELVSNYFILIYNEILVNTNDKEINEIIDKSNKKTEIINLDV